MDNACIALATCWLAITSWLTPQPQLSEGLLVVYCTGRCATTLNNAHYHWGPSYNLEDVGGCGASLLSPVHVGEIVRFSLDLIHWTAPCRDVDAGGRDKAWLQVIQNHEVAEVDWATATELGFEHGAHGYVWRGACLPGVLPAPQPYAPPAVTTTDGSASYPASLYHPVRMPVPLRCDERQR